MRTRIIAEAGANHNGDIELAKEMIRVAANCGADYIKFQSWQSKNLKLGDPNYERHRKSELSDADHLILMEECARSGIQFLTTCFDIGRIEFLASLGLKTIKIASPDCGSAKMISLMKDVFEHLIISTGMSYDQEVEKTAKLLMGYSYTFLHCVSLYPTPLDKVNIARMDWLRQFTPSVGFSDHTLGTEAAKLAIARGTSFVEKHFTLDRGLPGKDQAISVEPAEIKELVEFAAQTEMMMGMERPTLSADEEKMRQIYIGKWGDNR